MTVQPETRTKFASKAKVVHIDIDGTELSKTVNAVHGLRADVRLTLRKLLPLLKKAEHPLWWESVNKFKEAELEYLDNREGMTPRNAILCLNRHLSANTPVATDVGQHQMWAAQSLNFKTAVGLFRAEDSELWDSGLEQQSERHMVRESILF